MEEKPSRSPEESNVAVAEEAQRLQEPPRYAVVIHNDNYTTMEFVVEVLQTFFQKTRDEAIAVMLIVHNKGKGVAGIYSFEIAETKVAQVATFAQSNGHPLKCTLEPAEA